ARHDRHLLQPVQPFAETRKRASYDGLNGAVRSSRGGSVRSVNQKPKLRSYFVEAVAARADEVEPSLWNGTTTAAEYVPDNDKYQAAILDQYKLYVEMADRVSARRSLANTFFLTLNTAIFTTIGFFWKDRPDASQWFLVFPLLALLGQCLAWFWIV